MDRPNSKHLLKQNMPKEKTNQETASPKKKSKSRYFTGNYYIPSFGKVKLGDEVTSKAEKAWKAWSSNDIDNYCTSEKPNDE